MISLGSVKSLAANINANAPFSLNDVRWLILVRHGETDCNVSGRIAGQMPYPYGARLTANGRRSAKKARAQIRLIQQAVGIQFVTVSTVERAVETLQLCTNGLILPDAIELDGLRERGMGGCVLLPKSGFPELFSDPDAVPPHTGAVNDNKPEAFRVFVRRVEDCFNDEIAPLLREGNTMLVSHQYVTAAIEKLVYGWTVRETMSYGHKIPNSAPLILGLNPDTLKPVMGGLCRL